ncbi:MAG: preprotein translocase subunit SecE [Lachnospiraceae bacterium]|jgi:preprotein translocase subunit SecE|nr:preprotein translocase subunit SecE [Lachnospiraceae bacterium]
MAEEKKQAKKSWSKGLKAEFDKIIWTDRKTLGRQTAAVVVISAVICILITLVDSASLQLIETIIK